MAIKWQNNLSGTINQHSAPNLLRDEDTEITVNISQDIDGALSTRGGSQKFLDTIAGSTPVRGLGMYETPTGSFYLHMVYGGNLYVNGVSTWTSQAASQWASTSEISMTNFVGRHFMASSGSTASAEHVVSYTETGGAAYIKVATGTVDSSSTGSTLVATESIFNSSMVGMTVYNTIDGASRTVSAYVNTTTLTLNSAINDDWDGDAIEFRLEGKYLASNGGYMLAAGGTTNPRRTYFTNLDSAVVTHQTDYFISKTTPTGVASFGNGRPFVIFTSNSYMTADPASTRTNEVDGYGCVSNKSIQTVMGNLIWLGRDCFYMLSSDQAVPQEISLPITNDITKDAIFNQINPANWAVIGSVSFKDRYYCFLRTLSSTVKGQTLNYCAVEFNAVQNTWKVHDFSTNTLASCATQFINSTGQQGIYAGSITTGTVYKIFVQDLFTDDNSAGSPQSISSVVRSKHYPVVTNVAGEFNQSEIDHIVTKYYATGVVTCNYSLDGADTYTALSTFPIYTTTRYKTEKMHLGRDAKSLSIELTWSGETQIYAYGYIYKPLNTDNLKGV